MNKIINGLMILLGVLLLITSGIIFHRAARESEPDNTDTLSAIYKAEFMRSCNPNNNQYQYCSCTYDYLVDNYGVNILLEISDDLDDGKISRPLVKSMENCMHFRRNMVY